MLVPEKGLLNVYVTQEKAVASRKSTTVTGLKHQNRSAKKKYSESQSTSTLKQAFIEAMVLCLDDRFAQCLLICNFGSRQREFFCHTSFRLVHYHNHALIV